jgi:hypothetical protein
MKGVAHPGRCPRKVRKDPQGRKVRKDSQGKVRKKAQGKVCKDAQGKNKPAMCFECE